MNFNTGIDQENIGVVIVENLVDALHGGRNVFLAIEGKANVFPGDFFFWRPGKAGRIPLVVSGSLSPTMTWCLTKKTTSRSGPTLYRASRSQTYSLSISSM